MACSSKCDWDSGMLMIMLLELLVPSMQFLQCSRASLHTSPTYVAGLHVRFSTPQANAPQVVGNDGNCSSNSQSEVLGKFSESGSVSWKFRERTHLLSYITTKKYR